MRLTLAGEVLPGLEPRSAGQRIELSRQVSASMSVRGIEAECRFPVSVKGVAVQAGKVHEHKQAGLFALGEVPGLVMPDGYKRSIADWFTRLNGHAVS